MADWEERFDDYVGRLGGVLGHADRRRSRRSGRATWPALRISATEFSAVR